MNHFLILTIFLLSLNVVAQHNEPITGFWHDMPGVGSGYGEHYQLFEDSTFVHGHNQMDCVDSVINESGFYTLKKNKLTLYFQKKTYLSGGKLVPATGSCGSDYEIEGGVERTDEYHDKMKIKLSNFETDPEYDYLKRIKLNKYYYWKLSSNPEMF